MKKFYEIFEQEHLTEHDLRTVSPLKLAFLGDAIYDSYIRYYLINLHNISVHGLHKKAISYVKAASQAYIARNILDILSQEEEAILKRGRNQKSGTVPKNANVGDYKWATGFEALIGYLTLKGEKERVQELIQKGILMIESRDVDE